MADGQPLPMYHFIRSLWLGSIRRKHTVRWKRLSQLKDRLFFNYFSCSRDNCCYNQADGASFVLNVNVLDSRWWLFSLLARSTEEQIWSIWIGVWKGQLSTQVAAKTTKRPKKVLKLKSEFWNGDLKQKLKEIKDCEAKKSQPGVTKSEPELAKIYDVTSRALGAVPFHQKIFFRMKVANSVMAPHVVVSQSLSSNLCCLAPVPELGSGNWETTW